MMKVLANGMMFLSIWLAMGLIGFAAGEVCVVEYVLLPKLEHKLDVLTQKVDRLHERI